VPFQVENVDVLLAALRAMQACCVTSGFVKYPTSQEIACELVYGTMAALVGLLTDETQPALVRAEVAHLLGCVALGNSQITLFYFFFIIFCALDRLSRFASNWNASSSA